METESTRFNGEPILVAGCPVCGRQQVKPLLSEATHCTCKTEHLVNNDPT